MLQLSDRRGESCASLCATVCGVSADLQASLQALIFSVLWQYMFMGGVGACGLKVADLEGEINKRMWFEYTHTVILLWLWLEDQPIKTF